MRWPIKIFQVTGLGILPVLPYKLPALKDLWLLVNVFLMKALFLCFSPIVLQRRVLIAFSAYRFSLRAIVSIPILYSMQYFKFGVHHP
jgi:hypothetical protein